MVKLDGEPVIGLLLWVDVAELAGGGGGPGSVAGSRSFQRKIISRSRIDCRGQVDIIGLVKTSFQICQRPVVLCFEKTIEAEKHFVKLLTIGNFPYLDWDIDIESESYEYTISERLETKNNWETVKGERGNTLVYAYPKGASVKYQTLSFNSRIVEVRRK